MMQLVEGFLSLAAYALAIIATLRAGSRVSYLLVHDEIGVMEGPLILQPLSLPPQHLDSSNNGTSASTSRSSDNNNHLLYELAQSFKCSVQLSLAPHMILLEDYAKPCSENDDKYDDTEDSSSNVKIPFEAFSSLDDDDDDSWMALNSRKNSNYNHSSNQSSSSTHSNSSAHSRQSVTTTATTISPSTVAVSSSSSGGVPALKHLIMKPFLLVHPKRLQRRTIRMIRNTFLPLQHPSQPQQQDLLWRSLGLQTTSRTIAAHLTLTQTTSDEEYFSSSVHSSSSSSSSSLPSPTISTEQQEQATNKNRPSQHTTTTSIERDALLLSPDQPQTIVPYSSSQRLQRSIVSFTTRYLLAPTRFLRLPTTTPTAAISSTLASSKRRILQAYHSWKQIDLYKYPWLLQQTIIWTTQRPTAWFRWITRSNSVDDNSNIDQVNNDDDEPWDEDFNFTTTVSATVDLPTRRNHNNDNTTTLRTVEITAYAPEGFAHLRSHFAVSGQDFYRSIFGSGPYVSFQSNSKGAARTGGLFFFTRDGAYMIKTIRPSEARTFLKMLPKYYKHMKKHARRSLLTRFFGMYRVRLKECLDEDEKEFIIVIMNSVFPAEASKFVSERFDLKGSTVGRECSVEERQQKGRNAILKDLDLAKEVELVRSFQPYPETAYGLHIGPKAKAMLLAQLRRDVRLLVDCNVMDYSLLVGIVNMDLNQMDESTLRALDASRQEEERMKRSRQAKRGRQHLRRVDHEMLMTISAPIRIMLAPSWYFARKFWSMTERTVSSILTLPLPYYGAGQCVVDGGALSVVHGTRLGHRAIYYMGVIDFLQPWTVRKVMERQLKGMMGYDTTAISCVDPKEYAARFLEYIEAHVS